MIETWYFCSSVQASPVVTQQFMTVIHILRSRRAAPELIQLALRELARAEPVMRRYALPEVVALGLRHDLERSELQRDVREMLTDALHVVDIDVRDALLSGWDALLRNAPPDEVLVSLRVAIDRAEHVRQPQPPEPAPYVHSEDFVAEIGLLSVCLGGARRDALAAEALAANEAVGTLVRGGLANGFGRLALLLAAELASVLGEEVAGAGRARS